MNPKLILLRGREAIAAAKKADGSVQLMFHLPAGYTFDKPVGVRLVTVTGSTGQLIVYADFVEPQPTSGAKMETILGVFPGVNNPVVPLRANLIPGVVTVRLQSPDSPHIKDQLPTLNVLLALE